MSIWETTCGKHLERGQGGVEKKRGDCTNIFDVSFKFVEKGY